MRTTTNSNLFQRKPVPTAAHSQHRMAAKCGTWHRPYLGLMGVCSSWCRLCLDSCSLILCSTWFWPLLICLASASKEHWIVFTHGLWACLLPLLVAALTSKINTASEQPEQVYLVADLHLSAALFACSHPALQSLPEQCSAM